MRAVRAKLLALLAVLALLLPGGAQARAQYYCQMARQVVASCCCEDDAASGAASSAQAPAQYRIADCCRRITSASLAVPSGTLQAVQHVATAPLLYTLPPDLPVVAPADARSVCSEVTQAPLAIGPPLFVEHCALLS
jgi:hypothetical protein